MLSTNTNLFSTMPSLRLLLIFLAGLETGLIIGALTTYRGLVLRIPAQVIKNTWGLSKPTTRGDADLHTPLEKPSKSQHPAAEKEHKPFNFRPHLWKEPPEGPELNIDNPWHACKDTVQKEFKAIGGPDFVWKTNWLDIRTETDLLRYYREWTADQKRLSHISETDRTFYNELDKDVSIECKS